MSPPQKQKSFPIDHFLKTAMTMMTQKSWQSVTPYVVIEEMGLDASLLPSSMKTNNDIFILFETHIMDELGHIVRENEFDSNEPIRDRLFDVLMDRFELMIPYREGLKTVFQTLPPSFSFLPSSFRPLRHSMKTLLGWTGENFSCPKGELKLIGLSIVYLKTAKVWLNDETDDLSKTMAELDKNLRFAGQIASTLRLKEVSA